MSRFHIFDMMMMMMMMQESYTVNKTTILKLKKNSILSGVESDVLDTRGFYVFRKSGTNKGCFHILSQIMLLILECMVQEKI